MDVKVTVLQDAITDHRPVLAELLLVEQQKAAYSMIWMRSYRNLSHHSLIMALSAQNLSKVYAMENVDLIHDTIESEIIKALDLIAPARLTTVKNCPVPLHLKPDTGPWRSKTWRLGAATWTPTMVGLSACAP